MAQDIFLQSGSQFAYEDAGLSGDTAFGQYEMTTVFSGKEIFVT